MSLEHQDNVRRIDTVSWGLHDRLANLREMLRGRKVLVVGSLATSNAVLMLLRWTGARFMAAQDLGIGLHLVRRFAVDIVLADAAEDDPELAAFERLGAQLVRLAPSQPLPAVHRSAA